VGDGLWDVDVLVERGMALSRKGNLGGGAEGMVGLGGKGTEGICMCWSAWCVVSQVSHLYVFRLGPALYNLRL
jgi:hypothetical protein